MVSLHIYCHNTVNPLLSSAGLISNTFEGRLNRDGGFIQFGPDDGISFP